MLEKRIVIESGCYLKRKGLWTLRIRAQLVLLLLNVKVVLFEVDLGVI